MIHLLHCLQKFQTYFQGLLQVPPKLKTLPTPHECWPYQLHFASFQFVVPYPFQIVGCTKCCNIISMCTPSFNYTIADCVCLLAWAAHSSLESFMGFNFSKFKLWVLPLNLIKCSHTISTNLGLDFPRQKLHEHLSFFTLNFYAQDNSHAHNLSFQCCCQSVSPSWSCISSTKFTKQ